MSDSLFDVQTAIYNALAAAAEIPALIGTPPRVYDHAPAGADFPYVTFGALHIQPYDDRNDIGFEQIVTLDIWSRYRGTKEAKDIVQALYDTLHRTNLTVSTSVFLACEFHSADVEALSDGLTTHAAVRFSVITQTA